MGKKDLPAALSPRAESSSVRLAVRRRRGGRQSLRGGRAAGEERSSDLRELLGAIGWREDGGAGRTDADR